MQHYFQHGGGEAIIVRVTPTDAVTATMDVNGLPLEVSGAGVWGNNVVAHVNYQTKDPEDPKLFNLFVADQETGAIEAFRNVSTDPDESRYIEAVLQDESSLVRIPEGQNPPEERPGEFPLPETGEWFDPTNEGSHAKGDGGTDGGNITDEQIIGNESEKTGIYALEDADIFNLLCIPPAVRGSDIEADTFKTALAFCAKKRAMLIVDAPNSWLNIQQAVDGVDQLRSTLGSESVLKNGAIFFPQLKMGDALKDNRTQQFVPCGAIAGIFARTDVQRGVWKSPAGIDAGLAGVREFTVPINDPENGRLNPLGVNCLRKFKVYGNVIWGSRTLAGADQLGSEWEIPSGAALHAVSRGVALSRNAVGSFRAER